MNRSVRLLVTSILVFGLLFYLVGQAIGNLTPK